jgi:hypothetical protein
MTSAAGAAPKGTECEMTGTDPVDSRPGAAPAPWSRAGLLTTPGLNAEPLLGVESMYQPYPAALESIVLTVWVWTGGELVLEGEPGVDDGLEALLTTCFRTGDVLPLKLVSPP